MSDTEDKLNRLTEEFDRMLERMQTVEAKAAARSLFSATPQELGQAAVSASKLYGELLEKARKEVLETISVDNELIRCQIVKLADPSRAEERLMLVFTLNNVLHQVEVPLSLWALRVVEGHKEELGKYLMQQVSDALARVFVAKLRPL